jgi:hypothetical protein
MVFGWAVPVKASSTINSAIASVVLRYDSPAISNPLSPRLGTKPLSLWQMNAGQEAESLASPTL